MLNSQSSIRTRDRNHKADMFIRASPEVMMISVFSLAKSYYPP